ncbi:MAG: RNA polymerase sporulation sigma factor SigK [Firmicutes bacterium]|nr:RNA polymerase sporulation sigma factor SigK [Bacillota bacterium]
MILGYLANSTFPQPLKPEEEAVYLRRWEQGDMEARNILIERNLRLVAHVVKKYDHTGEDVEDLISIGTIGLIKAINTYSTFRGTRLATYAARCIENEILMNLRAKKKHRLDVSLHDPIGIDREGNEITLMDILTVEEDGIIERLASECDSRKLEARIRQLSRRERLVLSLRYGLGRGIRRTQREIAKLLGISRSYVSRIEKKALGKLGRDFLAEGLG